MPVQVIMPQLGESVVEGTLTKWLKAPGDHVDEFEPLLEINTDKVDTEVPSPATGTLTEILAPEGATVRAGALLAIIETAGEVSPAKPQPAVAPAIIPPAAPPLAAAPAATPAAPVAGRDRALGFISPVVAKIAGEHGVDLFQVPGTGQGGRITKKDILAYLENRPPAPAVPAQAQAVTSAPASLPAAPTAPELPGEILPLNPVRRATADHMVMSKHTSPHVTTIMEVDLSRVIAHRQNNKDAFARDGVNLTFTAYFISAAVAALKAYPLVNSSWSEAGILLHREINIGMATSLGEAGLIVPVIKNADGLSLLGLARQVNDLANRARARQLKPDEVKGGTFTITNHGISGSLFATPIINQPQCAILGVGIIQKRVVVIEDAIAIRPMAYLGLTFDHRILDGAIADYFLGKIVDTLQKWS
ncbi:MAG: 2-oxo acid dehydrogenase subunit E2 [Anaerolineales bacterium]|nr:2-oxo acid dehydrogenase subunit E2 [Anaerolineales bacterium]